MRTLIVAGALLLNCATSASAQYYSPGPSIPLPRPSPYIGQLTRQLIQQNATLDRIGPTPALRAGAARIKAGKARLDYVPDPKFSIVAHLSSMVAPGPGGDPLRALIRAKAVALRDAYQGSMRASGQRPTDIVDTLAYAFTRAFKVAAGRDAPAAYVAQNARTIRAALLNNAGFQGMPDIDRQRIAEELGVRAAFAEQEAMGPNAAAAREQALVILTAIYGGTPDSAFLASVSRGNNPR